jgi:hypothetical protein
MDKESNQCKGKCGCEREKIVNFFLGIIVGGVLVGLFFIGWIL